MADRFAIPITATALLLSGCISIPRETTLIDRAGQTIQPAGKTAEECAAIAAPAARSPARGRCARRTAEPWLRIPKVALYTAHPLAGRRQRLLLANLLGINFSVGTAEFKAQLRQAEAVVASHHGPLIVAGDFNTWSAERARLLTSLTTRLGLQPVEFNDGHRIRVWNHPLDHVFYRGLRVLSATSTEQPESDHNPLLVRFALSRETLND